MTPNNKVYVAGPDVFRADALEHFKKVDEHMRRGGWEPLIPFDVSGGPNPTLDPTDIYLMNLEKIKACDIVMANMTPFRGTEPDSGTCFEVGMAIALGKKVVLYMDTPINTTVLDRTETYFEYTHPNFEIMMDDEDPVFPDKMRSENFGMPLNLMFHGGAETLVFGGYFTALVYMNQFMRDTEEVTS